MPDAWTGARSRSHAGTVYGVTPKGPVHIMKKIAIVAALVLLILLLTKIANQVPLAPPSGTAFSLRAQQVVQCSIDEVTLVDMHQKATHLEKDDSWPDCSVFQKDDVLDFYLSRGAKTRYLSREPTEWWRKAM